MVCLCNWSGGGALQFLLFAGITPLRLCRCVCNRILDAAPACLLQPRRSFLHRIAPARPGSVLPYLLLLCIHPRLAVRDAICAAARACETNRPRAACLITLQIKMHLNATNQNIVVSRDETRCAIGAALGPMRVCCSSTYFGYHFKFITLFFVHND